jgi:uncharacterized membrane protein YqjE
MVDRDEPRKESIFGLARQLASGLIGLARLEVQQARQEVGASVGRVKRGSLLLGLAAAFALLALITLVAFVIFVLVALTGLAGWLVSLIVLIVFLALMIFIGWRGVMQLREVKVKPEDTIASVKEDIAWAKRLIRRD